MSRIVRKQLFSMWEALQEAQQLLDGMVRNGQHEEIMGLLADCQNEAIAMGSQIEAVYGEGCDTVHCLEEYCESLYHITEHMDDTEDCAGYRALAGEQLAAVQETMKKEIADRMEIVFFPCKASEWDCLASIYQAAVQEGKCEVYCVPLPFYELKPDGTYGEIPDERGAYPENVRMTGWQDYEFEVRKPDVIFIHNPYDGQDTAERVDERFYAENLRMYTENLIYVPYLLPEDIKSKSEDDDAVVQMKQEGYLPGVIHADKVIVHSESMRDRYLNEYMAGAEAEGMSVNRVALEAKILAFGSPRADGIRDSGGRSILLPEEWSRIIWKPDGERKKVILYNTCINALLTDGMKLLDKMEQVFTVFREQRDEIALWWRPQPLIKRMFMNMSPELRNRYSEFVERYKEEGWGIYDDTDDEARALTATDACYGDWSTIAWEYQNHGKPVMKQNADITYNTKNNLQSGYETIPVCSVFKDGNEFWVSSIAYSGLFKINALNYESEFIRRFDRELGNRELYRQILPYHEWLIFLPENGRNIALFNRDTYEMEYVKLLTWKSKWEEIRTAGAYIYDDELWIWVRNAFRSIIIVNLKSRKVRYKDIWDMRLPYVKKLRVREPYFGMAVVREDEIWLPVADAEQIVRYSFADDKVEIFRLKKPGCKINSMDLWDGKFWLTFSDKAEIMKWDPATGREERYEIHVEWEKWKTPFSGVIPLSDSQCIVLPSGADKMILRNGNEWKKLEYPDGFHWNFNVWGERTKRYSYSIEDEKVFIFPAFGNMALIYDRKREVLEGKTCMLPKGWSKESVIRDYIWAHFLKEDIAEKRIAYEKQEDDLINFLGCILGNYAGNGELNYIGKKILGFIMENKDE